MLVSHLAERHEFHNLLVGFITLVHPLHFLHFLHFCLSFTRFASSRLYASKVIPP